MRLWPRSLLWRTTLLIAILLIATQLGSLALVIKLRQDNRPKELLDRIVELTEGLREEALGVVPEQRHALLLEMAKREDVKVYREGEMQPPGDWDNRPLLRRIANQLRRRLGADTRLAFQSGNGGHIWVGFAVGTEAYWLVVPRLTQNPAASSAWMVWVAILLVAATAAGYLIVAHVSRPIRALALAAERIAGGEEAQAVPESGPNEIAALAGSFNRMADSLRRAEADRALLLAGVSHDLRTPLARLRLGLELLPDTDARLKSEMERDIVLMDGILGQFLAYVRGQAGEAVHPACDLNALLRDCVSSYASRGESVVLHESPLPLVPLRPVAVQRLAANLIDNALKYGEPPVEISAAIEGEHVVIAVSDRGPGIPPTELDRVLLPFNRLDSARSAQGSGLGLAIADRIARLHGGKVKLANRRGGGLEAFASLSTRCNDPARGR
jgi:two-component system osmolarity sensor histidine kinase EnvZ